MDKSQSDEKAVFEKSPSETEQARCAQRLKWCNDLMPCSSAYGGGFQESLRHVLVPTHGQGKCPHERSSFRVAKQDLAIGIDGSASMREDGFKVWIASSRAFEKMHSGPYEKAASNPYDDGDVAIDIPSSGPSSVEGQQSEEEMLVMMEESGMDPSEIVSVLQLDAGNIVMWVCLIGCCCFGCNTINLCGYNGSEDHSRHG